MPEAQAKQEELKTLHAEYQTKDSAYKKKIAFFNVKRVEVNYNMKSMEREFQHADDMAEVLNLQVVEVNSQIEKVASNMDNYKDTASYLVSAKEELEYIGKNIKSKSDKLLEEGSQLNERKDYLQKKTEEINSKVTNAELKMHFEMEAMGVNIEDLKKIEYTNASKSV